MRLRRRIAMAGLVAASSAAVPAILLALSRLGAGVGPANRGGPETPAEVPERAAARRAFARTDPGAPSRADDERAAIPPDPVVEFNRRANALAAGGRVREALEVLRRAEMIDPREAPTYYNRGRILHRLGRYDEALAAYEKALAARPDYAKALTNRAIVLARAGETERALADLSRAIALAPHRTAAYYHRARLRLRRARERSEIEAARADLDRLIELDPRDAGAYLLRAEAAESLGDTQSAVRDRERAREIQGRMP